MSGQLQQLLWVDFEKSCQSAAETPDEKQQEDHSGDLTEMVKHLRNTDKIPDAWPEDLKDIPIPSLIAINVDEELKALETEEEENLKRQQEVFGLQDNTPPEQDPDDKEKVDE